MHLPPHQNRFIMFMIQHHATKITKIMKDAGLPQQQINLAFGHFDERAAQHFANPNVRNLADMENVPQRRRPDLRLEQEALRVATREQQPHSDDDEAEQEDEFGYDTSHGTTSRATESIKKRPMKGQGKAYHPKPGASTVTNFCNAHITNFNAAAPMDDAEGEDTRATPRLQRYTTMS
eukprot:6491968-Amphidinium_carterae.2